MQWDDLRIFLAVARGDGLSAAARQLRIDPATVGRRISRLEVQTGTVLFVRSPTGYVLTEQGERLLPHAEAAEGALGQAQEALADSTDGLLGLVRIGAPDGVANFLLPQVTAEIAQSNPGLEIQIVALPRTFSLSKREADMAVSLTVPSQGRVTSQKIADYRLHLAASRTYLNQNGMPGSLQDLKDHPLVGYIPDLIFSEQLNYFEELGLPPPDFASNSVAVQMNWIRQSAGIGIIHDFAVPAHPGITRILTDSVSLRRTFYLLRHADDRRRTRLNRFAEALVAGLRREIARLESAA